MRIQKILNLNILFASQYYIVPYPIATRVGSTMIYYFIRSDVDQKDVLSWKRIFNDIGPSETERKRQSTKHHKREWTFFFKAFILRDTHHISITRKLIYGLYRNLKLWITKGKHEQHIGRAFRFVADWLGLVLLALCASCSIGVC